MSADSLKQHQLTEQIIQAAFQVHNVLGQGFLEKVYENALALQLRQHGLDIRQQAPIRVSYLNQSVGDYFADLLVANSIIVELKAVERIQKIHEVQLVNYLKATGIEVGLILNFGQKVEIRRKIFTPEKSV